MVRELSSLEAILDSFPKYLVVLDPGVYTGTTSKGILICDMKEFLLKEF